MSSIFKELIIQLQAPWDKGTQSKQIVFQRKFQKIVRDSQPDGKNQVFPFHIYCLGLNIWDRYIFYLFPFSLKDIYGLSQNPLSTNGSFWIRLKWCRCIYWGKARQVYRAMYCGIILLDPLCNIICLNLGPPSQLHKNIDIQRKLCVWVDLSDLEILHCINIQLCPELTLIWIYYWSKLELGKTSGLS